MTATPLQNQGAQTLGAGGATPDAAAPQIDDDQPSTYSTPEEEMDRNELRTDLQFALARLAPSLREAFVMKHVEGRSYEEMALLLETTVGALKMRVHRAREALQQLLEEKYA